MKTLLLTLLIFTLCGFVFAQTDNVKFETVKLSEIGTILLPSNMEVQSGDYKTYSDTASKATGIEISGDTIIFRQKGLKHLNNSATYAQIVIKREREKPKDFQPISSKIVLSKQELKLVDEGMKTFFKNWFKASGTDLKLIRWDEVSMDIINERAALKIVYLRQLDNTPPVYVENYLIDNNGRQYTLILSYPEEDFYIWKDVFAKVKESFTVADAR